MTHNEISPDDAARALSEVADRRRQVAGASEPALWWYFPAHGVLAAVFFALTDLSSSPLYWVAALAVFGAAASLGWLAKRRQLIRPHPSLYGARGWVAIGLVIVVFAVAVTGAGLFFEDRGVERPGAATGIVAGVLLAGLGTWLRYWLRKQLTR